MAKVKNHFRGIWEFREIGRSKASFKCKIKTEEQFWQAVKPYLMSNDLEFQYDMETNDGKLYAGMFQVGSFKKIGKIIKQVSA